MGLRGPGANRASLVLEMPDRSGSVISRQEAVIQFIEQFRITKGALTGKPFMTRPFQRDVIRAWYATDENGKRIVRTGLYTVGRKNGKTGLIAGLAAAHLVGPEMVPRGEIVAGATDRDQSGIIFDELVALLDQKEEYREIVNIKRHEKVIENLQNGSKFRALSSDAKKAHGLNPSVVILDELAQWGQGVGRGLYDALATSQGAWDEPLLLIIGTQAADDHDLMSNLVDYAKAVNAGTIDDPSFSGFIYEIPEELDVFDEANWILANPALGDFRTVEDMRLLADKARRIPTLENTFRNLYCNQRVDAGERWLPLAEWKPCIDASLDINACIGQPCIGGLDLSSVRDLTSFALFWPKAGALKVWSWCPGENLREREERDRVPYTVWAKEQFIIPTPGAAVDKKAVVYKIAELCAVYQPQSIAFDRWGITEIQKIVKDEGINLPELVPFGQGYKDMSPATKAFEERVINQLLKTPNNPLLTWAISNVAISRDAADNKKPDKDKSRERIDPAIACIMAVGHAATKTFVSEPQIVFFGQTA